jgi:serine/threonine protein kinase
MDICICPGCGEKVAASLQKCTACNSNLLLKDTYLLHEIIGCNQAITYLASLKMGNRKVIIKELSIHKIKSWKEEELFIREMRVLRQLNHPQIPKFLDYFNFESGKYYIHYLVQQYVKGTNLKDEFKQKRYTDSEVFELILDVLKILKYLQSLNPAVIHRDIKLSNLIRKPNGSIVLIDFGSVKDVVRNTVHGDTVAGTFGYMAPEQFMGKGLPQTDIYAVGVLALVLLTHLSPEKMMNDNNILEWKSFIKESHSMYNLLEYFLQLNPRNRPLDAEQAFEYALNAMIKHGKNDVHHLDEKSEDTTRARDLQSKKEHIVPEINKAIQHWSCVIREYKDIPIEYSIYFPIGSKELPYIIRIPEIKAPRQLKRYEKLLCIYDDKVAILEKNQGEVLKKEFPLESITYIVHGEVLLHSWLNINTVSDTVTIPYNTVNDEIFNPIIMTLRRKLFKETDIRYNHEQHETELTKLDYLYELSYKFYNYSKRSILPGAIIISNMFQKKISVFRTHIPNSLFILTDKELLLLQDTEIPRKTHTANYGMISTYVPLRQITTIDFSSGIMTITLANDQIIQYICSQENQDLYEFRHALEKMKLLP